MKKIVMLTLVSGLFAGCAVAPQRAVDQASHDAAERERWAQMAEHGDAEAQYKLGNAYCCGTDGYWDTNVAIKWWCAAALRGHTQALAALATHGMAVNSCPPPFETQSH
ncbi:MAG: hypothetical protein U1F34_04300 [Gammaproteobacteria bacterium]